jgi:bifunctional DNA-binding transcriptional regulator/antitoxin component of YhaV-PrlF toxin-antitoxin module
MAQPSTELFADTRSVQAANGSYTVTIPREIVERYDIEAGDDVLWYDDAESEEPRFLPPNARES